MARVTEQKAEMAREDMQQIERRYRFIELSDGFRIEGKERTPVEVRLSANKTFITVVDGDEPDRIYDCFSMYAYRHLRDFLPVVLMQEWTPPASMSRQWGGAYLWVLSQSSKMLQHKIYTQWQRLLMLAPEQKRLVAKAIFAATFDYEQSGCEHWEELYACPYLVQDIIKYRAAAIACHYAREMAINVGTRNLHRLIPEGKDEITAWAMGYQDNRRKVKTQEEELIVQVQTRNPAIEGEPDLYLQAVELKNKYGAHSRHGKNFIPAEESPEDKQLLLEILKRDWKGLFSTSGRAGRSLRRTLMNLPGRIPARILFTCLPTIEAQIKRPITDRIELLVALTVANEITVYTSYGEMDTSVFLKASRQEILAALHHLSGHLREELPASRQNIARLISYVSDYCRHPQEQTQPHNGNLVGLTDKAIRWHQQINQQRQRQNVNRLDESTPTALPPIKLPDNAAITFLAQVKDIVAEGNRMQHCISIYAQEAVKGSCYLFHVDYKKSSASVMVNRQGRVVQSFGPHNKLNVASKYGEQILNRWGKKLLAE